VNGVSLVIADDHSLMCEGLRAMLEPPHEVVAVVHDGRDVLGVVAHHRPTVLLLDISMPGRNGLEILREMRSAQPDVRVIMLTMHTERVYADEAIDAGAVGYVLKSSGASELHFAIDEVLAGRTYVTPLMAVLPADEVPPGTASGARPRAQFASLTVRQQDVLRLLAQGQTTQETGERLGIGAKTVEFHRHAIRKQLGLTSQAAMVRFAVAAGIVGV
jgi:DNA-binding NarL/FixJ family response regulator